MTMQWNELKISCPVCKKNVDVQKVYFSADQEFRFEGVCHRCKKNIEFQTYPQPLAWQALRNDLEVAQEVRVPKPPALVIPFKPEQLSQDDKQFLKENGISEEEP